MELSNPLIENPAKTSKALSYVHKREYLQEMARCCKTSDVLCTEEVQVVPGTLVSCQASVHSVLLAVDTVAPCLNRAFVFCNVRPPGHHAKSAETSGFCVVNQVAAGVMYSLRTFPNNVRSVAIWDYDLHFPDGTVDILQLYPHRKVELYSIHQRHIFPMCALGDLERLDENGIHLRSLEQGCTQEEYWNAFNELLTQLTANPPDLLFISCGFDACVEDTLIQSGLPVTPEMFCNVTEKLLKCCGKVVSVMEGGYAQKSMAKCLQEHLRGAEMAFR